MTCFAAIVLVLGQPRADGERRRLAAQLCGLLGHGIGRSAPKLNLVCDDRVPMPMSPGPWPLDALLQCELESEADFDRVADLTDAAGRSFGATPIGRDLLCLLTRKIEVVRRPGVESAGLKRMSLLKRQAGVELEAFREWWVHTHGPRVARLESLLGANQYHVIRASSGAGHLAPSDLPDGVTELFMADRDSMLATFNPKGTAITSQASEMIGQISPFVVQECREAPDRP